MSLQFRSQQITAEFLLADGTQIQRRIEIRTSPITGRTARITYSRGLEREPGADSLPAPPPFAEERVNCPFCAHNLTQNTPRFSPELWPEGRMQRGESTLFPNLFPYGQYSAVSLFDDNHFVEIGRAHPETYTNSLQNCRNYLARILDYDPAACHQAITQNHLPSAGGSLLHPHLQVQADHHPANHQRFLLSRCQQYYSETGQLLFSDYLRHEQVAQTRLLGTIGDWQWLTPFAPEGFFEIWGILPGVTSLLEITDNQWQALAQGIICCQKFYRKLGRNGYNLHMLFMEDPTQLKTFEVRAVLTVRSNYAPWVRSDFTGFELGPGDMATFDGPEAIAASAREFWP